MKKLGFLIFLLLPFIAVSQTTTLKGTAYDADLRSKLKLVFVNNLTQREADHTGQKGDFTVKAEIGDLIIFSCPGYVNDTLVVEDLSDKIVLLRPSLIVLDEVVVSASKSKSEDIRNAYASAYSAGSTTILSKDGGVSLYNAFSKQSQQKRAFQKFITSELDEKVIDQKFNKQLVIEITKIRGQMLEDFMSYYRPTYSQIEKMSDYDIKEYILTSYQAYQRLPAEAKIYPPLPKTSFGGMK